MALMVSGVSMVTIVFLQDGQKRYRSVLQVFFDSRVERVISFFEHFGQSIVVISLGGCRLKRCGIGG